MSDDPSAYGVGPEDFGESFSDWLSIILDIYAYLAGQGLVGVLIGSGLMLMMWLYSDDMALPTVVLILISSALLGALPGDYQQTAYGIMVVGIAAGIFEVFRRYVN